MTVTVFTKYLAGLDDISLQQEISFYEDKMHAVEQEAKNRSRRCCFTFAARKPTFNGTCSVRKEEPSG